MGDSVVAASRFGNRGEGAVGQAPCEPKVGRWVGSVDTVQLFVPTLLEVRCSVRADLFEQKCRQVRHFHRNKCLFEHKCRA